MPTSDMEITVSSGNIFADLGFPNPEEAEAKALLIIQIEQLITGKGLMQTLVAPQIGLTEAEVAERLQGILDKFTIDRLRQYLTALKRNYG